MRIRIILLSLVGLWGCSEDLNRQTSIPNSPVSLRLYVEASANRSLKTPGGMVLITSPTSQTDRLGVGGIAVVRSLTEVNQYFAYDLACPVEATSKVRLEAYDLHLRCPVCQSVYDVLGGLGIPISGVSQLPLRRYRVWSEASTYYLVVSN